MTPDFWNGKPVFITGHTGFKGSWLSVWLASLGAHVTGFALPAPTQPSLYELAGVAGDANSVIGDIRDLTQLAHAMSSAAPEIIFHLAAQSLVRPSYADPVETFATNVMGTVHVLEAVRQCPSVRAVVIVTSDKCYENREWVWPYRENEAMGGYDPYSASKGCAEIVTSAYRRSFLGKSGTRPAAVASARSGNAMGGGDWSADRLVPDIVRAALSKAPMIIRNPGALRPWQHVLDPLHGYLMLAERLCSESSDIDESWNFGPWEHDCRNVERLVTMFIASWGRDLELRRDPGPFAHEANILKLDSSKARTRLGWQPALSVEEAVDWTVSWYRQWSDGMDMRATTLTQIAQYRALVT